MTSERPDMTFFPLLVVTVWSHYGLWNNCAVEERFNGPERWDRTALWTQIWQCSTMRSWLLEQHSGFCSQF